jgi:GTP cyclohydrolase I/GTP cyclohydrolase-4
MSYNRQAMTTTSHPTPLGVDLQATTPVTRISLTKAGITRSAKAIRLSRGGREQLFQAVVQCSVDLDPHQKGVHMSRFEEDVNESIDEVLIQEALLIEELAERVALRVVEHQQAVRSSVVIEANYPVERLTPVTKIPTQETYGLIGIAAAYGTSTRRMVGVSAQGMNACPCAQGLIRDRATAALRADGFDDQQIARIVADVPIATHNQRARGTLIVGTTDDRIIPADTLIALVEEGMSSEIYELMKRPDEEWVVAKAHARPRFVEDSVREMVRGVLETFPDLPDSAYIEAHQVNFETIHTHDVEAERTGLVGEIRAELDGNPHPMRARRDEWLWHGAPPRA